MSTEEQCVEFRKLSARKSVHGNLVGKSQLGAVNISRKKNWPKGILAENETLTSQN